VPGVTRSGDNDLGSLYSEPLGGLLQSIIIDNKDVLEFVSYYMCFVCGADNYNFASFCLKSEV